MLRLVTYKNERDEKKNTKLFWILKLNHEYLTIKRLLKK